VASDAAGPTSRWASVRDKRRAAFIACLLVSAVLHYAIAPIGLPHGFEVREVDGEAAIPVDLLAPEAPAAELPPPPEPPPEQKDEPGEKHIAPAAARAEHGVDAGSRDAGLDAKAPEAGLTDASADGATPLDGRQALADGGALSDAAVATGEGGVAADAGPPENLVASAGATQTDVILVELVINAEVIRGNPVGARVAYLLHGIPQWEEFMNGTDIDPVRDADWVAITGPSLIHTARDVVLIRYAASDAAVDRAVAIVAHKYDRGGRFDTGVPGVKATLAHADRAERVLLRAQSHVLAVVPPDRAGKVARQLVGSRLPAQPHPGEAVHLRLTNPHHPMPEIPESITEMRLRVVPRSDDGADVFIEGDTKDPASASGASGDVRAMFRRHNDAITSLITHGLLDHVEVSSDGPKVLVHDVVTRDQIETLTSLVEGLLGLPPEPTPEPRSNVRAK
jgi:hypothetical protein